MSTDTTQVQDARVALALPIDLHDAEEAFLNTFSPAFPCNASVQGPSLVDLVVLLSSSLTVRRLFYLCREQLPSFRSDNAADHVTPNNAFPKIRTVSRCSWPLAFRI